jgi:hypothetical protein
MQRVPRLNSFSFGNSILDELGRPSFMRPSVCEDFEPYLPTCPAFGEDPTRLTPIQRLTLDRFDHIIIHVPGDVEVSTGKALFT